MNAHFPHEGSCNGPGLCHALPQTSSQLTHLLQTLAEPLLKSNRYSEQQLTAQTLGNPLTWPYFSLFKDFTTWPFYLLNVLSLNVAQTEKHKNLCAVVGQWLAYRGHFWILFLCWIKTNLTSSLCCHAYITPIDSWDGHFLVAQQSESKLPENGQSCWMEYALPHRKGSPACRPLLC